MTDTKPRRRWFAYSVRTLLLLITVVAIWLGVQVDRAHRQRSLLAVIQKANGQPSYDYQFDANWMGVWDPKPPGPEWLRNLIGVEYFSNITGAFYWHATDDDIKPLCGYDSIRSINFLLDNNSHVTDEGLKYLAALPSLEDLAVQGSKDLTDNGLKYFASLKHLKSLALCYSNVTDAGLKRLSALHQLGWLWLTGTQVTDAGLQHLKTLDHLEMLILNETQVTKGGVADLQKALPHCQIEF